MMLCWSVVLSMLNWAITPLASEPLLAWSWMAVTRLLVRPSCRKKVRCPTPHSGALRNWLPLALPCDTRSASPVPMLCTAKSLNGLIVILLTVEFAVVSIRAALPVVWFMMWQPAHPTFMNA